MDLILNRRRTRGDATPGELAVDGAFECFTLEDVVRADPNPDTPNNEAKVYGETAIPGGGLMYPVVLVDSPAFGPDTIAVFGVPGYSDIRIHGGNGPEHTLGCILVGQALMEMQDGARIVGGTSQPALKALKAKVKATLLRGERVRLTVNDYVME